MSIKEKIANSKVVRSVVTSKHFNKALNVAGTATVAATTLMTSASAEGESALAISAISTGQILDNALPFINAALPVLCVIGGLKLGIRFLKGAIR